MIAVDLKHLLAKLTPYCTTTLHNAAGLCLARTHYEVTCEHWLLKCLEASEGDIPVLLKQQALACSDLSTALNRTLETLATGNSAKPVFSPHVIALIQDAWLISSIDLQRKDICSGALLIALISQPMRYGQSSWFSSLDSLNRTHLIDHFFALTAGSVEHPGAALQQGTEQSCSATTGGFIDRFCIDFTAKAAAGQLDPVFGRNVEIRKMVDILARRRKNNPLLVGEPGVGKTAVMEGFALRIQQGDVPELLAKVRLLGLDMGLLEAGAGMQGEFNHRLKGLIEEIHASTQPIILFIDEAHMLIGAGGNSGTADAANFLKPVLARGELRTCAATTWKEYKKYFEKDAALARRFQLVQLNEPDVATTTLILRGLRSRYEADHHVVIRDAALEAAAHYSDRYLSGRFLPDKAIDLIDTACARVKVNLKAPPPLLEEVQHHAQALQRQLTCLQRDKEQGSSEEPQRLEALADALIQVEQQSALLTHRWQEEQQAVHQLLAARDVLQEERAEHHAQAQQAVQHAQMTLTAVQKNDPLLHYEVTPDLIALVVSDWTGIPLGRLAQDQMVLFLHLEEQMQRFIKGQDQALTFLATALRAAQAGLTPSEQPRGVFLFVGPSGVGKSETALVLAEQLFGTARHLITINMTEFQEKHTVSRLIGSPPGYVGYGEGGVLTEAIRQQPYSVILLDEVEKSHPEVLNLFYQVFDKGTLSDGEGKVINFSNTIILMTSNLGSDTITQLNHTQVTEITAVAEALQPQLSAHFKPALLARMQIIPFMILPAAVLQKIISLKLERLTTTMKERHDIVFTYHDKALQKFTYLCQEKESGARYIDLVMHRQLLPKLAYDLLQILSDNQKVHQVTLTLDEQGAFAYHYKVA